MRFKAFFKTYYSAFLVLIILVIFSIFTSYESKQSITERRARLFEMNSQKVIDALQDRIIDYVQVLKGYQGLFYASDSITAQDWKLYTGTLNTTKVYPGIQAIGFAKYIPRNKASELENLIRKNGFPDFSIKSTFNHAYLAPIIYIEPFSGANLKAFGYDMYSDPVRKKAMDRAYLTGEPAMTQIVTLMQETKHQPGFLLYLPVYINPQENKIPRNRQNIKGFVYYPFKAHELMHFLHRHITDLNIEIYDGLTQQKNNLLFASDSLFMVQNKKVKEEFKTDTVINLAGTPWRLHISPNKKFGSDIEKNQPLMILILGLFISSLLFLVTFTIIKRKSEISQKLLTTKALENKKGEFIGIASHELKTPLTSIKAYIQLLERSDLGQKEKGYVNKANSNINKLSSLIRDLLDVSKVEAGQLQLNISSFPLKDLLDVSIENVQHRYNSHTIITPEYLPKLSIQGDLLRLEQVITNLLINAIKYSPNANKVYVDAKLLGSEVCISIRDEGIGVSKENQQKIFDRFFRAKELSPMLSGLGMGLYISNEIIKLHQGRIEVESETGKGAIFYVYLPWESVQ